MRKIPVIIVLSILLFAAVAMAQVSPEEEEANQKRMEAEELLNELNSMDIRSIEAQIALEQANNAYEQGMSYFNSGDWNNAIQSFDNAISMGNEALDIEQEGSDMPDAGLPELGDGIDPESMGQGVRSSDLPILLGIVFISVLVIMPVTYRMV